MAQGKATYPWGIWLKYPFQPQEAKPGVDFQLDPDGTPGSFIQVLRNKAYTEKLRLVIRTADPFADEKRLRFQFYNKNEETPIIAAFLHAAPFIICTVCGDTQMRKDELVSIPECLIRNPKNAADPNLYYRHQRDFHQSSGYKLLDLS